MANDNKYIPALRFPDFQNDGEWKMAYGDELFEPIVNKNHDSDLPILAITQDNGAIPRDDINYNVIVSDKSIQGYKIVESGDFIISLRSFQGGIEYSRYKGLCSPAYIILRKKFNEVCDDFYRYYFKSYKYIQDLNRNIEGIRDGKMISYKQFSGIKIPFPRFTEQQKIADCFVSIDKEIDATKRKLEQLKEYKNGLMQRLFPAKGKTTPELRFPDFQNDGEWRTMLLGEITSVVNRRNKSNRSLPIYSINNTDGFVPQSQQFIGVDSEARGYDISAYKIIGKHTFAYNPARINVGSIGYSGELKDILISSLYVCFKTADDVDDNFLMCFFNSYIFNQAVESSVEGGIRSYLFYENFSRISIAIPSLYEQKRIALCITSIEDMIKNANEQINLLEKHKKGLLQQFFPTIK